MSETITVPVVPYAERQRAIKESTYISYCSHWRKARFQWQETQHEYWREQMNIWEKKILRAGRQVPVDKDTQPAQQVTTAADLAIDKATALMQPDALLAKIKELDKDKTSSPNTLEIETDR